MPRDARVQVMHRLELQAAVEKVEPLGTIDVHGGAKHFLGEGLVHAQVGRAHGEVAEGDLHMQRAGDHVADQDEGEAAASRGDGSVDEEVTEPSPEEELAGYF